MSTVKVVAVFSIIFGCFAMLYPRFLHPIVLKSFGLAQKPVESDILANMPPPRSTVNVDRGRPGEDVRQMRPGHHPGLRAASEMRAQQQQAGSGRGMMGIVLPMYAVGIVLYLIYTLVKVFSKRTEPEPRETDPLAQLRNFKYDDRKGKFTFGEDFDPDDDFKDYLRKKHKQQELEELINKADDRHITEIEMRQLQQRLEETEGQMTRILQAMQSVQQHVSGVVDRASGNSSNVPEDAQTSCDGKTEGDPNVNEEIYPEEKYPEEKYPEEKYPEEIYPEEKYPEASENENKQSEKYEKSNVVPSDSIPDLESYEVLATNSNGSEESSDYSLLNENGGSRNSPEVENISSVTNSGRKPEENQSDIKNSDLSEKSDNSLRNKFEEDYENDFNINQTDCDEGTTQGTTGVSVEDIGAEDENTVDDNVILRKRNVTTSSKK